MNNLNQPWNGLDQSLNRLDQQINLSSYILYGEFALPTYTQETMVSSYKYTQTIWCIFGISKIPQNVKFNKFFIFMDVLTWNLQILKQMTYQCATILPFPHILYFGSKPFSLFSQWHFTLSHFSLFFWSRFLVSRQTQYQSTRSQFNEENTVANWSFLTMWA